MMDAQTRRRAAPAGGKIDYFKASDGARLRYALWRQASGSEDCVVFLSGRREFIEKNYETYADLIDRGFAVATFDWRGQGLSERTLPNRQKGHVDDFATYVADLAVFMREVVSPHFAGKIYILAHSTGGHCALRYLHDDDGAVTAAVLTAPLIGLYTGPIPPGFLQRIARCAVSMGFSSAYAIGQTDYTRERRSFAGNVLTHDSARFEDEAAAVTNNPELALGGATFGWVDAMFRSCALLNRPGFAEAIRTPVLIVSAAEDRVVSNAAAEKLAARLTNGRKVTIDAARHEILKETDATRAIFWSFFDEFIKKVS